MERFSPELKETYPQLYYEHVHRYLLAKEHIDGGRVLDLASGEGYGSAILAQKADYVLGIDIDPETVKQAKRRYSNYKIDYLAGDCANTKIESNSFDYIVSFETIEHLESPAAFVSEIHRILKPYGLLIISSPDKKEYSENNEISNPYHLNELYHHEFKKLLSGRFAHCHFAKQRLVAGSLIQSEEPHTQKTIVGITTGSASQSSFGQQLQQGLYSIAFCSKAPLPELKLGLFENKEDSSFSWDATEQFRPTLAKLFSAQTSLANKEIPPSVESLLKTISDIEDQNATAQKLIKEADAERKRQREEIERLRSDSIGLAEQIEQQKARIEMIREESEKAIEQRDNYQERYERIKTTFSWKATVPIRSIRRIIERIRSK